MPGKGAGHARAPFPFFVGRIRLSVCGDFRSVQNRGGIPNQIFAQADQIVRLAQQQAEEIVDRAVVEANAYRSSASQYMDDMLGQLEENTTQSLENLTAIFGHFHNNLSSYIETIRENRTELLPQNEEIKASQEAAMDDYDQDMED